MKPKRISFILMPSLIISEIEKCPVPPKMKLLVLVNPHSGPGKAMQIYQRIVAPMLDEADIQVKVIQTGTEKNTCVFMNNKLSPKMKLLVIIMSSR